MASSESPSTATRSAETLPDDPPLQPPAIEPADREYLVAASTIPGSHYGARIGSNAALWALANQRQDIDKRISVLTARNQRSIRTARYSAIAAVVLGIMSTVGAAYYTRQADPRPALVSAPVAKTPKAPIAPPVRPQTAAISTAVPAEGGNIPVAQKANAAPSQARATTPRKARRLSPGKRKVRPARARASRWIAQPLHGAALRRALIADRKRTRELNQAQLRKLTRRRRD